MRYLDCPKDSFPWKIRQLLEHGSTAIDPVAQFWHELIGESPHASLEKFSVLPSPFCGWACVEKEKGFLACMPPLLLRCRSGWSPKVGSRVIQQRTGFPGHMSDSGWSALPRVGHIQMEQIGISANSSPMRDRNEVASSLFFWMFHQLTYMLSRTLERLWTG